MTKIEILKNSAEGLFGRDTPTINGEEYLALQMARNRKPRRNFIPKSIIICWQKDKKK